MAILAVTEGTSSETSAQTIECSPPASIIDDNYLRLIASAVDSGGAIDITVDETGWNLVKQVKMSAGLDATLAIFIKKAASESGNYTVNISGGVNRSIVVQCSQFSGLDLVNPEDAAATSTTDQNDSQYDPPAIVTATDNAFVETVLFGRALSIGTPTVPSGYTEYGEDKGSTYYLGSGYIDAGVAGSENPGLWGTFGVVTDCMGITWAMRPATAGGGGSGGFGSTHRGEFRGVERGIA